MVWIDPWARLPLKAQYTCKSSGCVLASVAEGWRAAPSALPSGPRLPTTLSVQTGHCSQSSFYFPAKSVLISGFFSPFLFYVCPTNKNTVEMGKWERSYCFLWCMVTIWAKIEPDWSPRSVCYSAGKGASRAWASPVASAGLRAAAPCGGPAKVAVRAFLWISVFFLSILWMLLLSDRKLFSSSIPDHAVCCLARRVHSFLLLAGLI